MKIAISNIAWEPAEDGIILPILHEYKIRGMEVAPTKIFQDPSTYSSSVALEYKKKWAESGIELIAMQSLLFGKPELQIFASEENRTETLVYLTKIIEIAELLGTRVLVFGSPKNRSIRDMEEKKARGIALEFFRSLADIAHRHGVKVCIEPNPIQYQCDFITNTSEGVAFVKEIDHPGLGFHLDLAACTFNKEDLEMAVTQSLPVLQHVHISEPFLDAIGQESTNHSLFADTLRKLEYQGWVSIEMKNNVAPANEDAVRNALHFVTEIYGT